MYLKERSRNNFLFLRGIFEAAVSVSKENEKFISPMFLIFLYHLIRIVT